jgi:hypothetical protein
MNKLIVKKKNQLQNAVVVMILILIVTMPFHALLVVTTSSLIGQNSIIAAWKEVLILLIASISLLSVWAALKNKGWRRVWRRPDVVLITLIGVSGLAANIVNNNLSVSMLVGVKTTFLPLILFLAVQPVAKRISRRRLTWAIMIPAVIVAVLAILQFILAPTDFLTAIGYNSDTILPFQAVHPDFPFGRSFSTLGGPNQLGSYLILPMGISLALAVKSRSSKLRWVASIVTTLFVLAALTSFSRSSLIGIGLTSIVVLLLSVPKKYRLLTLAAMAIGVIVSGMLFWRTITNESVTIVDRYLLRGELTGQGVIGGDEGHITALVVGATKIIANPGGLGFGTAGPASFYSNLPLITENWYLQIAVEVGIVGLILLLLLMAHILAHIYRGGTTDPVRIGFVAAGFGILTAAMFLHTLADSTLAILFFGSAGILYATNNIHEKKL